MRHVWAVMILAIAAFGYPLIVIAGGAPRFPARSDCARPPKKDQKLEVVFGRFESRAAATARLGRVLGAGFKGSVVEFDACGLLRVVVHGVPTLSVGRDLIDEVRSVGLKAKLEQDLSGG